MKALLTATATLLALSAPAYAEGDIAKGEKLFKKCKACHMIVDDEGTKIYKGGKTGPNLYGIIGRVAGTYEDFKYGKSIIAAGEGGLTWDEETLAAYVADPKAFLREVTGDGSAKSKMSFKLKKGGEDVAAYLASVSPEMAESDDESPSE
ncbi:MAG: c-type cytochrome [Rhodobacterales bacterium]|nr:c-type cytochrome [Rhodobacterales bacterium]